MNFHSSFDESERFRPWSFKVVGIMRSTDNDSAAGVTLGLRHPRCPLSIIGR